MRGKLCQRACRGQHLHEHGPLWLMTTYWSKFQKCKNCRLWFVIWIYRSSCLLYLLPGSQSDWDALRPMHNLIWWWFQTELQSWPASALTPEDKHILQGKHVALLCCLWKSCFEWVLTALLYRRCNVMPHFSDFPPIDEHIHHWLLYLWTGMGMDQHLFLSPSFGGMNIHQRSDELFWSILGFTGRQGTPDRCTSATVRRHFWNSV